MNAETLHHAPMHQTSTARSARALVGLALLIPTMAGCAPSGPPVIEVRGTVTYQGKPVSFGMIAFQPVSMMGENVRPAVAEITPEGTYELRAFPGRKGARPGDYRVSVEVYTGSHLSGNVKYIVPKRYADPLTSGLTASVPAAGPSPVILDWALAD